MGGRRRRPRDAPGGREEPMGRQPAQRGAQSPLSPRQERQDERLLHHDLDRRAGRGRQFRGDTHDNRRQGLLAGGCRQALPRDGRALGPRQERGGRGEDRPGRPRRPHEEQSEAVERLHPRALGRNERRDHAGPRDCLRAQEAHRARQDHAYGEACEPRHRQRGGEKGKREALGRRWCTSLYVAFWHGGWAAEGCPQIR